MKMIMDMIMDTIMAMLKALIEQSRKVFDIAAKVLIGPFAIMALTLILLAFFKNEE